LAGLPRSRARGSLDDHVEKLWQAFTAGHQPACRCGAAVALSVDYGRSRYAFRCSACAADSSWFTFESATIVLLDDP
jgi:hypothetical protein